MSTKAFGLSASLAVILIALAVFASSPRWVYGYIRDAETNQPLAGVPVAVGDQRTVTDGQGYFQQGGVRGLQTVRAAAQGYQTANVSLAVASFLGLRQEISLRLKPVELRGTVTDAATHAAIAGATVQVANREVQTDKRGRYSIKRLLPGGQVVAVAQYYAGGTPAAYTGQPVQDIALTLLPVTVLVRNEFSGEPIAGATVKAAGRTVQSDPQGQVVFPRLQPGTEVLGSLKGFKDGRVKVNPGDNAILNLRPPIIKGTVRDAQGQPLANALVLLRRASQDPQVAYTNAQGEYLLQGQAEGASLLVRRAGYKRVERQLDGGEGANFQLEPFVAKGIYIQFGMVLPEGADLLKTDLDLVDRTELNAVVIDVKSDKGFLAFRPRNAVANQVDAYYDGVVDIRQLVADCKRRGIYTIARMVIFKDTVLAEGKPEWAIHNGQGGVWRDDIGSGYGDPFRQEVWRYNVDLAVEAAELGFDEIQFDYLRFPSDGNIYDTNYIQPESRAARTKAMEDFVAYARKRLDKTGVFFSLDLFGLTTSINLDLKYGDLGIGQELGRLAPYADYISPMVYPSTYIPGNLGLRDPQRNPYEVVQISVTDGRQRAGSTLIRPWLQHYSLGDIAYGTAEFRAEKQAATAAGAAGWLFWNAAGEYDAAVFDP